MIDVVIPVAYCALLLPWGKFSWVDTPEITHVDIKAASVSKVACTALATMDNPGLCRVNYAMHKQDDIESFFVCNAIKLDYVAILCLARVTRVFIPSFFD